MISHTGKHIFPADYLSNGYSISLRGNVVVIGSCNHQDIWSQALGAWYPMMLTTSKSILATKLTKMLGHKLVEGKSTIGAELWYHTWDILLEDFFKCTSIAINSLFPLLQRERLYFRMVCGRRFFLVHMLYFYLFFCWVLTRIIYHWKKKKIFLYGKTLQIRV